MKILWKGNIFNPTGIATANREIVKELSKLDIKIQSTDPFRSNWEFNKDLEHLNNAIDVGDDTITIFADYPQFWKEGYGKLYGMFLHEGTLLIPGWVQIMNQSAEKVFVPSEATKNLFKWNDVQIPIEVVPFGTNPEIYMPAEREKENEDFVFLSVNSWTGEIGDRKGTDLLIQAFDEEFKDEKVKLLLKIGTFWDPKKTNYAQKIFDILGHVNKNIIVNEKYLPEKELTKHYQKSDCFVAPTRGESFGLTIINAMACGLPVIVTKDINSGHMDFCKGKDSVLFVDAPTVKQGDLRFFTEGNMLAEPNLASLKKQMRYAFEHKELREKAITNSDEIRTKWSWKESARKLKEAL